MSTTKLGPARIKIDDYDDWLTVDAFMEFQSAANTLHYYEVVAEEKTGAIKREVGEIMTDIYLGVDSVKQFRTFLEYLSEFRAELKR